MRTLNELVRNSMRKIKPYSCARDEYQGKDGIFLDANENPFGELNRYPDPYQKKLKMKLAEMKSVSSESIFIGNGSDEVIDLAFRIFCEPAMDKALTFVPTYGMYEVSAAINQVELIQIPLNDDFQIDFDSIECHLADPRLKLIFICSPNNPTGNSILNIGKIAEKFDGIVFVDEAYIDFSLNDSMLKKLPELPNLIISQTFSKAFGLAAARVGMAFSNPKIIDWFNKIKPPYNVSMLNQQAALECLNDLPRVNRTIDLLKSERDKLTIELNQLKTVKRIYPSHANFLLIEVTNADKVYEYLTSNKIVVRNRSGLVKNGLRITIGTPQENLKLLNALQNYKA